MEPPFSATRQTYAKLKSPYKYNSGVVKSLQAAVMSFFIGVHSDLLCWPITWAPEFRCCVSKGIQTGWKTLLVQNILQNLIITSVPSFKKELTRSCAEAQVLQVKSRFISLHYLGTGSRFQENAFHTITLLKGVSACLWQEFKAGTQAPPSTNMGFRSHILYTRNKDEWILRNCLCKSNYQIELMSKWRHCKHRELSVTALPSWFFSLNWDDIILIPEKN